MPKQETSPYSRAPVAGGAGQLWRTRCRSPPTDIPSAVHDLFVKTALLFLCRPMCYAVGGTEECSLMQGTLF